MNVKWKYWTALYTQTYCTARGLRPLTIKAYADTLKGVEAYVNFRLEGRGPDELSAKDLLDYIEYLRRERKNGASAINRQVTVLRYFYRAMVAMKHLDARDNPMAHFPKIKGPPRKLPATLDQDEVRRLIEQPRTDTVLGLRDRAIVSLLYGAGIRASECATLLEKNVDVAGRTICVSGKGGHERRIPLNEGVLQALVNYRCARGEAAPGASFFRSREARALSRNAIYERVRSTARKAHIQKRVYPHLLRHTFATDMVKAGVHIVTLRDLLGHRQIASTQIYIHMTADDLRHAAELHPVGRLINRISDLLPNVKIPMQYPTGQRYG